MRLASLLLLALACGCADFFTPPCTKTARAVCDVGSEGDACAFLLNVPRNDARAQGLCKELLPQAEALQANPSDAAARIGWQSARTQLATLGLVTDERKSRIGEKLKAAGGEAGRIVERAEQNAAMAEEKTTEAALKALEAEGH